MFEEALVKQIKYALKKAEGEFLVRRTDGRIYVDAQSDFDFDEVVESLKKVFGISGICPVVHVEDEGFEKLCQDVVLMERPVYQFRDWKLDHLLTSRLFGYPAMILLLAFLLWLTITGANYPSQALAALLFRFQDLLTALSGRLHAPEWLHGMLVLGIYRVVAWVVSVMLPPMAVFFPLL